MGKEGRFTSYEQTVHIIQGVLGHKKWKKPAERYVNELLFRIATQYFKAL
jgi:hypothetical protein